MNALGSRITGWLASRLAGWGGGWWGEKYAPSEGGGRYRDTPTATSHRDTLAATLHRDTPPRQPNPTPHRDTTTTQLINGIHRLIKGH